MENRLKYTIITVLLIAVGFAGTAKVSSRTVAPKSLSVCGLIGNKFDVQFVDNTGNNSSDYGSLTDEVQKKRSHKRRRKVRPPKKGR